MPTAMAEKLLRKHRAINVGRDTMTGNERSDPGIEQPPDRAPFGEVVGAAGGRTSSSPAQTWADYPPQEDRRADGPAESHS
jgi:hypothetical protein